VDGVEGMINKGENRKTRIKRKERDMERKKEGRGRKDMSR
jgi:hypothetical protein